MGLFFILLATAFAHNLKSVSMVEKIFLDPVAFAQSFENASPSAVNAVIDMVNDLIAEGNGKKADIIKAHEDAVAASAVALDALNVALDVLETATGERIEADDEVTRLKGVLQQKRSAEADALSIKNAAKTSLDNAQAWMDSEVTRVDAEKGSLEEVLQILADLPEGFRRRLLSSHGSLVPVGMIAAMASTDPDAVQEVVDLVQALIDAGKTSELMSLGIVIMHKLNLMIELVHGNMQFQKLLLHKMHWLQVKALLVSYLVSKLLKKLSMMIKQQSTMQQLLTKKKNKLSEKNKFLSLIMKMSNFTMSLKSWKDCYHNYYPTNINPMVFFLLF